MQRLRYSQRQILEARISQLSTTPLFSLPRPPSPSSTIPLPCFPAASWLFRSPVACIACVLNAEPRARNGPPSCGWNWLIAFEALCSLSTARAPQTRASFQPSDYGWCKINFLFPATVAAYEDHGSVPPDIMLGSHRRAYSLFATVVPSPKAPRPPAQRKRAPEGAPFDDHKWSGRQASLPSFALRPMGGSAARGCPWNRRQ